MHGIDALIFDWRRRLDGDRGGGPAAKKGVKVIGVPKTIDRTTRRALTRPSVSTSAVAFATDRFDRLQTTRPAHFSG